ncbi:hypothetical protein ACOI1H_14325 [Loktanella sp. DJP18]
MFIAGLYDAPWHVAGTSCIEDPVLILWLGIGFLTGLTGTV